MLSNELIQKLQQTAVGMMTSKKGILAADESYPSIEKKFKSIGIESTEESRRDYREMLLTAPDADQYISGVILFDETLRQSAASGEKFVDILRARNILPGIKVDQGTAALAENSDEKRTLGLEGLPERLAEYSGLGAAFTKWRAVITIGESTPSKECLEANLDDLVEYAKLSQQAGLVPMVEPETLMDGSHTWERCAEVTREVLLSLFSKLKQQGVYLPGLILKINMVVPGKESGQTLSATEIAKHTLQVLEEAVPSEVAGVVFLSGGQSEIEATENLDAINRQGGGVWPLSFSYGRALQDSALKVWKGEVANVNLAQEAFLSRARLNSLAVQGQYQRDLEPTASY